MKPPRLIPQPGERKLKHYENAASHSNSDGLRERMDEYRAQAEKEREPAGSPRVCDLDSRRRG
jgi:hypothetical protein